MSPGTSVQLQVPTTVYAGEATNVNCTSSVHNFKHVFMPIMVLKMGDGCTKHDDDDAHGRPNRIKNHLQKLFTITCKKGNHTIECMTNGISQTGTIQLQGVFLNFNNVHMFICILVIEKLPKIINKPRNITTDVGLPVTLTCYVEGDPSHYWVGWMSRHAVIQAGEEHSISTSPNFKSTNGTGTTHHLTIHSVKEAGKYECKVYTITGDVQDQLTHHIIVSDHDGKDNE